MELLQPIGFSLCFFLIFSFLRLDATCIDRLKAMPGKRKIAIATAAGILMSTYFLSEGKSTEAPQQLFLGTPRRELNVAHDERQKLKVSSDASARILSPRPTKSIFNLETFVKDFDRPTKIYRERRLEIEIYETIKSEQTQGQISLLPDLFEVIFSNEVSSRGLTKEIDFIVERAIMSIVETLPFPEDLAPEKRAIYDIMDPLVQTQANEVIASMKRGDFDTARAQAETLRVLWEIQLRSGTISMPENIERLWNPDNPDKRSITIKGRGYFIKKVFRRDSYGDFPGTGWVHQYTDLNRPLKSGGPG